MDRDRTEAREQVGVGERWGSSLLVGSSPVRSRPSRAAPIRALGWRQWGPRANLERIRGTEWDGAWGLRAGGLAGGVLEAELGLGRGEWRELGSHPSGDLCHLGRWGWRASQGGEMEGLEATAVLQETASWNREEDLGLQGPGNDEVAGEEGKAWDPDKSHRVLGVPGGEAVGLSGQPEVESWRARA